MASEFSLDASDRFSVDDVHRMAEAGIWGKDVRVKLVEGEEIDAMSPVDSRVRACLDRFAGLLTGEVGLGAIVRVRGSIQRGDRSKLVPDFALLRPNQDFHAVIPAMSGDVFTRIEVMDSSAGYDREIKKLGHYAREGVAEVWLVDLNKEWIEVHRRPISGGHTEIQIRPRGESVSPEAFPDLVLAVDSILG